jgi:hypothetical protein
MMGRDRQSEGTAGYERKGRLVVETLHATILSDPLHTLGVAQFTLRN